MNNHAWGEQRILTYLKEGREMYTALYKGNRDVKIPAPRFISCWVSEVCNLDCTYCYFSDTNHEKSHQFIDADRFIQWLSQAKAAGAESLEFSGGGEPTLHPRFEEIFTRANGMGYQLGIITHACNPMPLEKMTRYFKYVRCGLDAATAATHDAIKRNKRKDYWFPKAIENIKELVRLRDLKPEKDFTVGIKVVLNAINKHEITAMVELADFLGVDYIQIKHEHSSDHPISEKSLYQIQGILNDLILKYDSIRGLPRDKSFQGGYETHRVQVKGTMSHARATTKCFMSPIHTVVTATGKVLQCCFFENRPIGTIFQEFPDMWGSDEHRKVVEMTTVEECDRVDCRFNFYNSKMKEIIEDPLAGASFI